MKRLVWIFIVLFIAIGLGFLVHQDSGYVLIAYNNWTLETSIWIAITAVILFFFALYFILRLLGHTRLLGSRFQKWGDSRKQDKARRLTNIGLCALAEGKWKKAEDNLIKSAPNASTPLINYLAAARAAQAQNEYERRDDYLRQAHHSTKGSELAVGLTQAELQINGKQWEQALATLKHLNQLDRNHSYLLKLLYIVYKELGDWENLQTLLPSLKKNKVLSKARLDTLEKQVYQHRLTASKNDRESIEYVWQSLPKNWRNHPDILHSYAKKIKSTGETQQLIPLIESAIKKQWHEGLVESYADLANNNSAKQLVVAESWLKKHPKEPALLKCVGLLSLKEKFFGKAKDYLEESMKIKPQDDTLHALGLTYEALGDQEKALECYRTTT